MVVRVDACQKFFGAGLRYVTEAPKAAGNLPLVSEPIKNLLIQHNCFLNSIRFPLTKISLDELIPPPCPCSYPRLIANAPQFMQLKYCLDADAKLPTTLSSAKVPVVEINLLHFGI